MICARIRNVRLILRSVSMVRRSPHYLTQIRLASSISIDTSAPPLPSPQAEPLNASANLSPLQIYERDVKSGRLHDDEHQRRILASLEEVYASLLAYHPPDGNVEAATAKAPSGKLWKSVLGALTRRRESSNELSPELRDEEFAWPGPKGLYIYGDVGCGKTMLMDIFYSACPNQLTKRRVHFHQFMQGVHKRSFALKKAKGLGYDTADEIAREIASSANVLCFDEMQVTDVGDAMILRRILRKLYELGVVTFYTSNRAPDELYKNGVQRELFVPTIHLLQKRNCVIDVDSKKDYRSVVRPQSDVYFFGSPSCTTEQNVAGAKAHAQKLFACFACGEKPVQDRVITVWGRPITVPFSAGNRVAQFTFKQLCGEPHSSADYLEICKTFDGIVLTEIPSMTAERRDLIRRFITFLDAAYDAHTKLAVDAAKSFDEMCADIQESDNKNEAVDEVFAFSRALSRLRQMSSRDWLEYER